MDYWIYRQPLYSQKYGYNRGLEVTFATYLESRLTKLETRIEDNDVGSIGKDIEQLRGANQRLADKVSGIRIPATGQIKSDIKVLQNEVKKVQKRLERLDRELNKVDSNPLG